MRLRPSRSFRPARSLLLQATSRSRALPAASRFERPRQGRRLSTGAQDPSLARARACRERRPSPPNSALVSKSLYLPAGVSLRIDLKLRPRGPGINTLSASARPGPAKRLAPLPAPRLHGWLLLAAPCPLGWHLSGSTCLAAPIPSCAYSAGTYLGTYLGSLVLGRGGGLQRAARRASAASRPAVGRTPPPG